MASCLGLYIENNLIKYAKVTKERDTLRVDAFGVKFYDKIGPAINQIVSETYSYKVPISINLSEEVYQYFYFFSLLNKKDLNKAVETEFDSYCVEKGFNRNALETRFALVPDMEDAEKIKAIYISVNKAEINKKIQDLAGNYVSCVASLPMCISNLAEIREKDNVAIVNLEEKTTITTIIKGQIYDVTKIDEGMGGILSSISIKENSYSKAYEICKNTTIYTSEASELQTRDNQYLEDMMPTLYNVVQSVREIVDASINKIEKIYITGLGCIINNLDLYFQEYFGNINCEILRPYFVSETFKINMKDYIEVNSAIALAMQGLGYGLKTINFKKKKLGEAIKIPNISKNGKQNDFSLKIDWKQKFDGTEKALVRTAATGLLFLVIYSAGTLAINNGLNLKEKEVDNVKQDTLQQINLASADIKTLNNKISDYEQVTKNLQAYTEERASNLKTKNAIPLLLSGIMKAIPKGVTITSIENTTGSHIVINAQSADYDLLGFFKGSLGVNEILVPSSIISTSGIKQNGVVKVVIEGDMP